MLVTGKVDKVNEETHSLDQSERYGGVELDGMSVVGLDLLRLEDVALESDFDW